ncbi:hypothetical protein MELA_01955 [Candidatus Methylomirabilis lanthanidiphila]|uniref:Polymerase beta nucleotidyltransferase domain-containing protein n=1 Tax=Candidatus Methylomirabilis lanthanidiphila TaxID=2211376 RepID=A0A564ZJP6_9BACT|nr:nucleotidyltransferase domain-containing protein [Candidatus Methylomirabilis lanthanidiphila]VUZ85570.1 hypothetical protein MELA_01955 [Candidatus Methylomirabilis lanthanidiphila]
MEPRQNIINYLEDFFRNNAGRYGIDMAFLYGSWARGCPRCDSDIDIAVVFSQQHSRAEEMFEHITDISLRLSGELSVEVNAIAIDPTFGKPMLCYNAIVSGIPVFMRDFSQYVDLKNKAVSQMEDFSLFGRDWQRTIAKRNLEALPRKPA